MNNQQPKPDSKHYSEMISDIQRGIIKIPKFQREFVWSIDKTAQLLDSILKGYPIGTFILWQTDERLNEVKNIGNLEIPETPDGTKVQYVLDGQQRITSLYAAYLGAEIRKSGEKKITDYNLIYVDLQQDINDDDVQVITSEKPEGAWISLSDVLNFLERMPRIQKDHSKEHFEKIYTYANAFSTYDFSTILLRKESVDSAIEVFTRINTGGQTLTLFEIMSAKTYDEAQDFDMQDKWAEFITKLAEKKYEGISSSIILSLLSLILSKTKECKRKTILKLEKQDIIATWDEAISSLEHSIDYFRTSYGIPVSQLLPYDALLVPFAYFFFLNKEKPDSSQRKLLGEFFWRASLSSRYSSATESNLAQDIKRVDLILNNERPKYDDMKVSLNSSEDLINTNFSAGNSYCKAVLCLLAYQDPKDFQDNGKVILDNSWLKVANSKNYHHFFPKAFLKKQKIDNANSLMNITFVSDHLNKRKIGASAPSVYIGEFAEQNDKIEQTLASHLIDLNGYGIESNDYEVFLKKRSERIYKELKDRLELTKPEGPNPEIHEVILSGETESVEFKSTLRFDVNKGEVNKKLEYVIAKTIAAFLNTEGGCLIIGVDDNQNILGLDPDIKTLTKKTIDGFQLHLIEIVKKYVGAEFSSHIKISFPEIEGITICMVKTSKSSRPVFTEYEGQEDFFIRVGCSSQPLSRDKQSQYEKSHWQ